MAAHQHHPHGGGASGPERWEPATLGPLLALALLACQGDIRVGLVPQDLSCGVLDPSLLADGGVGRDGIPALSDPELVEPDHESATSYLSDESRVIAVNINGEWIAFPHNLMYRHEIVNMGAGGQPLAITYCPLTGSALVFERASLGGSEFGVSGLLFQSNLMMYDRASDDSLWPQMARRAACGPREGQPLVTRPVLEMTWSGFKTLFPVSRVVAVDPVESEIYRINPYGTAYENPTNGNFVGFPIPRDTRRLPKERVLGFPGLEGQPSLAFPFQAMAARGGKWSHEFNYGGQPAVVLWDRDLAAAVALRPVAGERRLTLEVDGDKGFVDEETGSVWTVAGQAVQGPLRGERMPGVQEAYVAFWWPWAAFHPGTELALE